MTKRIFATALTLAMVFFPALVRAQDWPTRPIHFIVPFPAGGSTDISARIIADYVTRKLGQQVYVENKSGANGVIGMEVAAKSDPDGYTFLVSTDSLASNPHIYKINIDVLKDLVPVLQISHQPMVLAAHPSLGVKSISDLIALAKKEPGLRFATGSGIGSSQAMVALWFAQIEGLSLIQVPYRGGGQAINDLISGQVKLGSLGSTPLIPHYKAGSLLLLAQSTETRSSSLPDVPTFEQAGVKGLVLGQWVGVFAPAKTPQAILTRLAKEIESARSDPGVRDRLLKAGQDTASGTPEQFTHYIGEEFEKYGKLVTALHIKVD